MKLKEIEQHKKNNPEWRKITTPIDVNKSNMAFKNKYSHSTFFVNKYDSTNKIPDNVNKPNIKYKDKYTHSARIPDNINNENINNENTNNITWTRQKPPKHKYVPPHLRKKD